MPPVVIDVRSAEDSRDVVHRAVQALAEGKLVALPTETVYGLAASALDESAVRRLIEAKGRSANQPLSLAIRGAEDALDYVPDISPLGRRLTRRCWPGPVTLVLKDEHPQGLVRQLPQGVQDAISPNGTLGLRVPAHQIILDVLRLMAGPLALTSANRSGEPDAVTAAEIVSTLGDHVSLILDDGQSQFGQPSSVVRVVDSEAELLRAGVVNKSTLKRLSTLLILFVCTGNTCRSPMAEMLMRQRIAKKLECKLDDLEDRGVAVMSAGIAAMMGGRPSTEAVNVMQDRQLDLTQHESQPLSDRLVRHADLILTMTRSHREAILAQWPYATPRTELLCTDGGDVSDPIGGPKEVYERCAAQIDGEIVARLNEFDFESLIGSVK